MRSLHTQEIQSINGGYFLSNVVDSAQTGAMLGSCAWFIAYVLERPFGTNFTEVLKQGAIIGAAFGALESVAGEVDYQLWNRAPL